MICRKRSPSSSARSSGVAALDRVDRLVRLLEHERSQAGVGLPAIPRAAVGRPQAGARWPPCRAGRRGCRAGRAREPASRRRPARRRSRSASGRPARLGKRAQLVSGGVEGGEHVARARAGMAPRQDRSSPSDRARPAGPAAATGRTRSAASRAPGDDLHAGRRVDAGRREEAVDAARRAGGHRLRRQSRTRTAGRSRSRPERAPRSSQRSKPLCRTASSRSVLDLATVARLQQLEDVDPALPSSIGSLISSTLVRPKIASSAPSRTGRGSPSRARRPRRRSWLLALPLGDLGELVGIRAQRPHQLGPPGPPGVSRSPVFSMMW